MNKKYYLNYAHKQLPGDTLTPVGVYLRLRDVYPCSLLLECTDYSSRTNAFSYICLNPVIGIETGGRNIKTYFPHGREEVLPAGNIIDQISSFLDSICIMNDGSPEITHGLFGFTSFESAALFEKYDSGLVDKAITDREVPLIRYDFYKVILTFNHFNNTLSLTEYFNDELPCNESERIMSLLANHNSTSWPFALAGEEQSDIDDLTFMNMVKEAVKHCAAGDVFQLVVSRRYRQKFSGDEFNVYRALRSVNPSPYLFYFDYIAYRIFGSSPEAQIKIRDGNATINPIAGTIRRTGNFQEDIEAANDLLADPKENSEHVMLVDLARNDLSRSCSNVRVEIYREVQTFSHLMHLVSTVTGDLPGNVSPFTVFADTFPAGTLSGAPKHKAIELINSLEDHPRGYYGGAIGYIGLNRTLNHAIIIRSFLSRNGYLNYQAGAGIVIKSSEVNELNEVSNKLEALRQALRQATRYVNY